MLPDDLVCYCFHVKKRKILSFLRVHKPAVASQLSECGGAGTGCGWCIPFLKRYFQAHRAGREAADDVSTEDYAAGRREHIQSGKGTPPPGAEPA